jgi:hypothetical protein
MTNPTAAMRMLITYAICIPLAVVIGYVLTNPLDYGTIGFLGIIALVLISPILIKWYYPLLVFGLACPAIMFFLPGRPLMSQAVVVLAVGIIISEQILKGQKPFAPVRIIIAPLIFLAAVIFMTAELNGGIGFHSFGSDTGGGKKYAEAFIGIATFFALASRAIPPGQRKLYICLAFLPGLTGIISQLFPVLPSPLNYINLLFPPLGGVGQEPIVIGETRLVSFSFAVGTIAAFMMVRYGLRGIFDFSKPWRFLFFFASLGLAMLGGFRSSFSGTVVTLLLMFFLERLHRTRLLPVGLMAAILGFTLLACFSDKLPYTLQRSMSFLPFKWKPEVIVDAQGSSEWRFAIWRATWPMVPSHLLLGKGFTINKEDFDMMGHGTFSGHQIDEANNPLALSNDYHSGPLTTLMGFGIWGAIGMIWLMGAALYVLYQNYKYGDPDLMAFNAFTLAGAVTAVIFFFFVVGGFASDIGNIAKTVGFSLAMNGGLARRPARPIINLTIKPHKPTAAAVPQPV